MQFFDSPTSPFVRKVKVLIHEAGITGVTYTAVAGTPVAPGTMPVDLNPLGKIPALVTPAGEALYDSRVICRFLDDHARKQGSSISFYPAEPKLWRSLTLEATADGMLEAALLMVYEERIRPDETRYPPWIEGQWNKIERALDALEERWMDHLPGPMDIGHIGVGCALGYLDFRLSDRPWRANHPHLAAWEAEFSTRPAMVATQPLG